MDVRLLLVILIIIVITILAYIYWSLASNQSESYEEVKANRRKVIKECIDQSRPNADKSKHKKPKKTSKKAKDKKLEVVEEVNKKKDAVLEVPKESNQQLAKDMGATKKNDLVAKITKPKLQNVEKEEPKVNKTADSTSSIAADHASKSDVDLKIKPKVPEKQPEPDTIPPVVLPKESEKKAKAGNKIDKKKQDSTTNVRRHTGNEKQEINVNSILSLIRKAEFPKSEIQLLIDTLLTSCEDETTEWLKVKKSDSGRQESTVKLKKQMSELEASLKNEKQITLSLQSKLKELRAELASDKSSIINLKDQVNKLQQEKDDLIFDKSDYSIQLMKVKTLSEERDSLQEQLDQEISKAQQQQKIDDDRHHETVLALKDKINNVSAQLEAVDNENVALKSNINFLQAELKMHETCQGQMAGMEQALNGITQKLLEKDNEVVNLREHLNSLIARTESLKKENQDLKKEKEFYIKQCHEKDNDISKLREARDALLSSTEGLKKENNALKNESERLVEQLNGKDYELSKAKEHIDSLMAPNEELKKENHDLKEEKLHMLEMCREKDKKISQLQEEKDSLLKEIQALKKETEHLIEKLRLKDIELSKGKEKLKSIKTSTEDPEKLRQNMTKEMAALLHSAQYLKSRIEPLHSIGPHCPIFNQENAVHHSSPDDHEKVVCNEKQLKQEFTISDINPENFGALVEQTMLGIQAFIDSLSEFRASHDNCEDALSRLQKNVNEKNDELDALKLELEKYKLRNNELRNKNWKVVEALSTAEKALQNKLKSEVANGGKNHKNIEELKNNVNTFVRRLFPDVTLQEYKGHFNDWLRSVEEAVSSNKMKYCPQDVQSQNMHLQSLVAHYKNIISDTEDMLNKLQNHIEVQEAKWKDEMSSLQKEIELLRSVGKNAT